MADTLNKFGVPVDGTRTGLLMPKLKNRFRVRFTNFGPLNGQQAVDLSRQINTVDKPKITYEENQVHSYNSRAYYAGKHEWQPIVITVRDDVTNLVSKLVGHQIQKQMNHFEQTSPMAGSNYKFGMFVEVLSGGNDDPLETWEVEGGFLTDVSYDALDYATTEPQMISMTVRYDNATLTGGLFPTGPELLTGTRI